MTNFQEKYLKYKNKYTELKTLLGGSDENIREIYCLTNKTDNPWSHVANTELIDGKQIINHNPFREDLRDYFTDLYTLLSNQKEGKTKKHLLGGGEYIEANVIKLIGMRIYRGIFQIFYVVQKSDRGYRFLVYAVINKTENKALELHSDKNKFIESFKNYINDNYKDITKQYLLNKELYDMYKNIDGLIQENQAIFLL
jgi:hypothetical protein